MTQKWAWVFPGQGSQSPGMGLKLFQDFPEAKAVFEMADDALGEKISKLCFEGTTSSKASLELTANAQPAILTVSAAIHAVFAKRAPTAAFVAGHSLGEYSALVAAGALPLTDGVKSVRARGQFMQEAVPQGQGAMAAVLGLDAEKIRVICAELRAAEPNEVVQPANYNSPEQTVIAGHAGAVARAEEKLKAAGAKRVVPLPVSAPFHSALMEPVKARLKEVLERAAVKAPSIPVVTNVEAKPNSDPKRVVPLLLEQVTAPVRWVECVRELERQGVTHLVELGPGKVLSGLVRRISKGLMMVNVEDGASLESALKELEAQ